MSIYATARGWGVDYRDEFGRRTRKFVGSQEAALALDAQLEANVRQAKAALRRATLGPALSLADALDLYLAHQGTGAQVKRQLRTNLSAFLRRLGQTETARLTPRLDAALREHTRGMMADTLLFSRAGKKINVGGQFLRNLRRKRWHPFKFHHLRHTFATRLAAVASNQFLVLHALGHALTSIAFNRQGKAVAPTEKYVHPSLEELRAAIETMDAARIQGEKDRLCPLARRPLTRPRLLRPQAQPGARIRPGKSGAKAGLGAGRCQRKSSGVKVSKQQAKSPEENPCKDPATRVRDPKPNRTTPNKSGVKGIRVAREFSTGCYNAPYSFMTTRTKAIFFDAGNTLVYPRFDELAEELTREGRSATPEDFRAAERAAKQSLDEWLWPQIRRGELPRTIDMRYWQEFLTALLARLEVSDADWPAVTERVAGAFRQITFWSYVHPETPAFLRSLRARGFCLGVISNSNGTIEQQLERLGLAQFFSVIIDSHHVGVEKPHPEIFKIALGRTPENLEPSQAVFVGDTNATDMGGAHLAGLRGILIDRVGAYPQVEAARITSLPELEPHL